MFHNIVKISKKKKKKKKRKKRKEKTASAELVENLPLSYLSYRFLHTFHYLKKGKYLSFDF